MRLADIEPGRYYAVDCRGKPQLRWYCLGHPDAEAEYEHLPHPLAGDDRKRWISDPRRRLHRVLVTNLRQPYGKTNSGVEVEGEFRTTRQCTCPECGTDHAVSEVRTERGVVHPQHIECRWDQADVWMAAQSVYYGADSGLMELLGGDPQ